MTSYGRSKDGHSDNHERTEAEEVETETSPEAAAVVRGISRSVRSSGRSIFKLPTIGSLPRHAVIRKRVPVRQVARLSDRFSTGIDLLKSAVESSERRRVTLAQIKSFVSSVVKNTILGVIVFETYSYSVGYLADDTIDSLDEYARASLGSHYFAGANAGCAHSVASSVLESMNQKPRISVVGVNMIHHGIAHSLLFGSYETIKRSIMRQLPEDFDTKQHIGIGYLGSVALSGGIAGQIQHVASHFTEQWLRLGDFESAATSGIRKNSSDFFSRVVSASPPTVRHTLLAFPASAIGFVAFEYGRSIIS